MLLPSWYYTSFIEFSRPVADFSSHDHKSVFLYFFPLAGLRGISLVSRLILSLAGADFRWYTYLRYKYRIKCVLFIEWWPKARFISGHLTYRVGVPYGDPRTGGSSRGDMFLENISNSCYSNAAEIHWVKYRVLTFHLVPNCWVKNDHRQAHKQIYVLKFWCEIVYDIKKNFWGIIKKFLYKSAVFVFDINYKL